MKGHFQVHNLLITEIGNHVKKFSQTMRHDKKGLLLPLRHLCHIQLFNESPVENHTHTQKVTTDVLETLKFNKVIKKLH